MRDKLRIILLLTDKITNFFYDEIKIKINNNNLDLKLGRNHRYDTHACCVKEENFSLVASWAIYLLHTLMRRVKISGPQKDT